MPQSGKEQADQLKALDVDALRCYQQGIVRLVARLKIMQNSRWSPTPKMNSLRLIGDKVQELIQLLETQGSAQDAIESAHHALYGDPDNSEQVAYHAAVFSLRNLRYSIRHAQESLPDPRKKYALSFAADAFLYLRYNYGMSKPKLTDSGPDITEFDGICKAAGIFLSATSLRNALSTALKSFDPHMHLPWFEEIF